MNRKSLVVIILAGLLALLGAFVIFMFNKPTALQPIEQQEEETIIPIPEPEPVKVEETKPEVKPAVPNKVKKVSYKKPAPKPTVNETPVIKPIVVKEAEPEVVQNEGVVQEDSKDIVITREYKMQSPARYTFK